ncbi:MAG TPA: aminotransferase class V-fold PLP-dependent enzyme [Longimicrobiaceae bacterium]|nr:aminotransferase class V-fold PLP-dependent enzyme [Longimicrobiaceae bacterium]
MLTCQKDRFSLPEGLHYLNCAYMAPLSLRVEEAGIAGIRLRRDPTRVAPADFFTGAQAVRERFARLVNAPDPAQVAIVPAVSYGMAVVARNTRLERGQNVVVAHEQFPSNVYPWRRLAAEAGAEVRTVAAPERTERRGEAWNARLLEAIDAGTALVALGHVHWADGTRFDLEALGARAREVGAALVVDGTQSVGALPFDVQRIRPDALVCASYKWMTGPYGAGAAWLGPRYLDGEPLEENWIGREASEDFAGLVRYRDRYQPGALRFDVGERSNPVLLPMLAAALDQLLEWTPEAVQAYCRELTAGLVAGARELGWTVEDARCRGGHLFGLRAPAGVRLPAVQEALARRRVAVSVRGAALRVSPNVYNDAADVEALLGALREAAP